MDLKARQAFINDIGQFLNGAETTLKSIFGSLGWTEEHLNKSNGNNAVCPINPNHKMPASSLAKHVEMCSWIKDGNAKEDKEKEVPSSKFFYENATTVMTIMIDQNLQNQILKNYSTGSYASQTSSLEKEVSCGPKPKLTTAERCAIYDYVVAQGRAANLQNLFQLEDLNLMLERGKNEPQKEKSRLEILAEQRDYKRRRQTYRAKNVHITKKSYTEVMRDLIETQMSVLNPNWKADENSNPDSPSTSNYEERKHESTKEEQTPRESYRRSRSRERERNRSSRSRDYEKADRYRDDESSDGSKNGRSRSDVTSRSKQRDFDRRRDRSRDRSRSHHKSHKRHKHSHRRGSSSDDD